MHAWFICWIAIRTRLCCGPPRCRTPPLWETCGPTTPFFDAGAGGSAYTDSLGNNWSADTGSTGGLVSSTTRAIANTPDPALYQTQRYGNSTYQFTVPPGKYTVILKFAEFYWTTTGKRLFNASINGTQVLTNFDIVAAAGAPFVAIDRSFPVTVTGSSITIQFTTGSADLPKIGAIQIKVDSGIGIQLSSTSASLLAAHDHERLARVDELAGLDGEIRPVVGDLRKVAEHVVAALDLPALGKLLRAPPLDVVGERLPNGLEVAPAEGLIALLLATPAFGCRRASARGSAARWRTAPPSDDQWAGWPSSACSAFALSA